MLGVGLLWTQKVHAQTRNLAGIYTCTDDRGIRRTSDRPIVECIHREQRVLNADGSLKHIVPPTLTAEERAEREAAERKMAEERAALNDAVRRDRNLKARFPNQAAHQKAREAALEVVRIGMRTSQQRVKELQAERKPLSEEAEFFRGRSLPARLKQQIEANETSVAAQRDLIHTQEAELARINRIYDAELEHLRKLWNGARPGSISLVSAPTAQPD
jgi:putative cell wall-binding protein